MKRILFVLLGFALMGYAIGAFASHNGIPTAGQERKEVIWACVNIEDARTFVTARKEAESYDAWIAILRGLAGQRRCMMGEVEYKVEEVVETFSGLEVLDREFGEEITFYIVKSNDHFVVTY